MPIPKAKQAERASLIREVAALLHIDPSLVYVSSGRHTKVYVWTGEMPLEERERIRSSKVFQEFKHAMAQHSAKAVIVDEHPLRQIEREGERRKGCSKASDIRRSAKIVEAQRRIDEIKARDKQRREDREQALRGFRGRF